MARSDVLVTRSQAHELEVSIGFGKWVLGLQYKLEVGEYFKTSNEQSTFKLSL
jgi:hypothetical protein